MERYFNVAGPCIPGGHCMLPAPDRMPEVRRFVGIARIESRLNTPEPRTVVAAAAAKGE